MRIISKFHDYYDIELSYGVDPTIVYDRKSREIVVDCTKLSEKNEETKQFDIAKNIFSGFERNHKSIRTTLNDIRREKSSYIIKSYGCVCFCGETHPFIECEENGNIKYIYSVEQMDEYINGLKNKKTKENYYNKNNFVINRRKFEYFL